MRGALEGVAGIVDIKTNVKDRTVTFSAPTGLDVKSTLDKIVEDGTKQAKNWSLNDNKKSEEAETTSSTDGLQAVSLKLPGMT